MAQRRIPYLAIDLIKKKRDGLALTSDEIHFFVEKAVSKEIADYQITAFLMAIYLKGMTLTETIALTRAFIASGETLHFSDFTVDKHSTGGVGDKISLILAPLVASLGVKVPMMSGRGLGHTGGTLDKLESIPGFRVNLSSQEFKKGVETVGAVISGQTSTIVPADKLFYSLRDVTGTVECVPLITSSILSKKIAEGAKAIVLDLKVGNGSFMSTKAKATKLKQSIEKVGKTLGIQVKVLMTNMDQPLGHKVGHTLEVEECLDVLDGKGPKEIIDLTVELAAHMLLLAKTEKNLKAAKTSASKALTSLKAKDKFLEMLKYQGFHGSFEDLRKQLTKSDSVLEVRAPRKGKLMRIDTYRLGNILVSLGGGRTKSTDKIYFEVGFQFFKKLKGSIKLGETLLRLHYLPSVLSERNLSLKTVEQEILSCFKIQ